MSYGDTPSQPLPEMRFIDSSAKPGKKMPKPLDAHHVWVSNKTPRRETQFLAVVVPYRENERGPRITPVGDVAVRVAFRGSEKLISFQRDANADVSVDVGAVAGP